MKIKRLLFAVGMISFMVGVMPRSNFASADQVNTGQLNINVLDSVDSSGIQGAYFQVTSVSNSTDEILTKTDQSGKASLSLPVGDYLIKQVATTDNLVNYTFTSIGYSRSIEAGKTVEVTGYERKITGDYAFSGSPSVVHVPLNSNFDSSAVGQGIKAFSLDFSGKAGSPIGNSKIYSYYNNVNTSIAGEYISIYMASQNSFSARTSHILNVIVDPALVVGGNITVKYEDTKGNEISDEVTKTGNVGDDYTTEQKDIGGYTFKEVKGNRTGKFTDQPQTVTYVYEKYQDKTSLIVHDSELTVGDTWKAEDNFDGATDYYGNPVPFTDISVSGDVNTNKVGTYKVTYRRFVPNLFSTSENQGTYSAIATIKVNAPAPVPPQGGDVTVKYEDTDGNAISGEVVKTGNVGENYTTEQKDIEGYTFKEVEGDSVGVFTEQPQTVTYVYIKNVEPISGADVTAKYVDTDGNKISDEVVKSGNIGESYSTEQKTISGYTFKEVEGSATGVFTAQAQTITYVYTKHPVKITTVIVKYVDTEGNKISDDVVKIGNTGEKYTTKQKDIEGYTFKEVKGSVKGTFTDQLQVVTYIYTKDKANTTRGTDVDNTPASEANSKDSKLISDNEHALPKTSENSSITFLTIILGFFLILVGVVVLLFQRNRTYK